MGEEKIEERRDDLEMSEQMDKTEIREFLACERSKCSDMMFHKHGIDNFHLVRLIDHFKLEENKEIAEASAESFIRKNQR